MTGFVLGGTVGGLIYDRSGASSAFWFYGLFSVAALLANVWMRPRPAQSGGGLSKGERGKGQIPLLL